jgi:hypothetical protein
VPPLVYADPAGETEVRESALVGPALSTLAIALADEVPTLPTLSLSCSRYS